MLKLRCLGQRRALQHCEGGFADGVEYVVNQFGLFVVGDTQLLFCYPRLVY